MFHISGAAREVCRSNIFLNSIGQYFYLYLYHPAARWRRTLEAAAGDMQKIKVAFICDEMTWMDFSSFCNAQFLLPGFWKEQLEEFSPDVLFCEAAWNGIDAFDGCWRGRVYHNRKVLFENRKELLSILKYCRQQGIWTVFWSKEDPSFFNHPRYDFTDTACRFDQVLTVSEECLPAYRDLGCRNVGVLPFSVNTDLFYPVKEEYQPGSAVFAGSWFADQPQRCRDLSEILDYALSQNWRLDIYDRHSDSLESRFRFPQKYRPYIHDAVPFRSIPSLARRYEWALNVNTVRESTNVYSRRILQMAACGVKVLTPTLNIRSQFIRWVHPHENNADYSEIICDDFDAFKRMHSSRVNFQHVIETMQISTSV